MTEKKTDVLRARVGEKFKRDFRKFCRSLAANNPNISESDIVREALVQFMKNHNATAQ